MQKMELSLHNLTVISLLVVFIHARFWKGIEGQIAGKPLGRNIEAISSHTFIDITFAATEI